MGARRRSVCTSLRITKASVSAKGEYLSSLRKTRPPLWGNVGGGVAFRVGPKVLVVELGREVELEAEAEFEPLAAISANVTGPFPVPARTFEFRVGEGVFRVVDADAEFFVRAAVMGRARWSASRAWAGETTEMRASSESRIVAMER